MSFVCRTFLVPDFAVDLGTATLRIWTTASDLVEVSSRIGARAPLRGGVVVDSDAAAMLLHDALQPLRTWHVRPPRVLATAPGDASEEERSALRTALHRAGAGSVTLIPEPVAAAVGAGLAGATSVRMLVDIGEGVTEVALVSRGVLLHHASIRLACAEMREAPNAAIATIAAFIAHVYVDLDRHLRERVGRSAICLTGGGALVDAMRNEIERALELPVYVPDDPLRAVIRGARRLLDGEAAHVWSGFGDVAV